MSLVELIKMSNKYGADAEFVLAGGGNTSFKDSKTLYIKGSGTSLATITQDGFVKMDAQKLNAMWSKKYSDDISVSEKQVLRDMMDARELGEEDKRPSVETLLHLILPFKLVLHVHPALVNGLTCGRDGEHICGELFGDSAIFMRTEKPGYTLAVKAKEILDSIKKDGKKIPSVIFMQNHGVFFGANSLSEMDKLVDGVMLKLASKVKRTPDFTPLTADSDITVKTAVRLRSIYKRFEGSAGCSYAFNNEIRRVSSNRDAFEKSVGTAFTPDHIVYCRHKPLFLDLSYAKNEQGEYIDKSVTEYKTMYGFLPSIVFVKDVGMFALGAAKKQADTALQVYLDEIKISVYSEAFGGTLFMTGDDIAFILNWEVESYRRKVSLGFLQKRLNQKIAFITGAAQGYGKGIAEMMAQEGANVVIADLNFEGAKAAAIEIEARFGKGCAYAVRVDVSDEQDVKRAINEAALNFGGLDILVNNAGIVRAGSLEEMDLKSFELVTKINYSAYFLCVKYAAQIMKLQYAVNPKEYCDVIQINSKSGLAGSNKNFAYAGSKFGGIGLTQSFALELTPYNIKVNSICPGNFFEGPLWADPEKGLFVQYLNAGKVPGAKTVADVKAFYESKIPMNRGCRIEDVARAIFYTVEQEYETGQAIPVTGGQVMLK